MKVLGVEVTILEADEQYPDSCFVEDTALVTDQCAIITNPGAQSRQGEIKAINKVIAKFDKDVESIKDPGTVDAGDIMMVGDHFFIGLSNRTNYQGASRMILILEKYGQSCSKVELSKVLHLKTGVSYLERNTLLATGEFLDLNKHPQFKNFKILTVPDCEAPACNSIWVNGTILMPKGFPITFKMIKSSGFDVIEIDISEYAKLDGGLSCLSLRF